MLDLILIWLTYVQVNGSFHTSDNKLPSYDLNIAEEAEDRTELKYDYKQWRNYNSGASGQIQVKPSRSLPLLPSPFHPLPLPLYVLPFHPLHPLPTIPNPFLPLPSLPPPYNG